MTQLDRTIADLNLVIDYWPGLRHLGDPAVRRPWREPTITPERRDELDRQAWEERMERIDIAPGEHPDAARPEVLDMLGELLWTADDVAVAVAKAAIIDEPAQPSTSFADPTPLLTFVAENLRRATLLDGYLLPYVVSKTADMVAMLTAALSLSYDGQKLSVLCPWCHGEVFGRRTLRVKVLPGDLVGIVCEFPLCSPGAREVGTWWQGRPVWPLEMWPWLAQRIARTEVPTAKPKHRHRTAYEMPELPAALLGCRQAERDESGEYPVFERNTPELA